ncbi:MAG: pitrilysin family protein, partial [Acidobacteriota bacterium]
RTTLATLVLTAIVILPTTTMFGATPATSPGVTLPAYQTIKLPNGATILLAEKHDVPLIAFTAILRGGALADPAGKEGTASLTADLLEKGAGKQNAAQFAEAVDSVGGVLGESARAEWISIRGEFLTRDTDLMLGLLSDMLRRPAFATEEFTKLRDRDIDSLKAAKDSDLRSLIGTYANAFLFGSNLYGRPTDGSEASLAGIERQDVLNYYKNNFGADRLVLAVVGDFKAKEIESKLRAALGDWNKAAAAAPKAKAMAAVEGRRVLLVDKPDATQTYFWIGNVGVRRNDPQTPAIDLANTVFGGRFTSLINSALRIESGLTYGAFSRNVTATEPGSIGIASYTKTDSTGKAVDMALDVLTKYEKEGITADALKSSQAYILGQYPPDLETGSQLAARLAEIEFYGLGRNDVDAYGPAISAASQQDVNNVIKRLYADPKNLTFVFIGKAEAIRDVVKKYGPVTEMKITDPTFSPK